MFLFGFKEGCFFELVFMPDDEDMKFIEGGWGKFGIYLLKSANE